jgi:hypothetical protein
VLLESSAPRLTRDVAAKLLELLERVKGTKLASAIVHRCPHICIFFNV